MMVSLTSLPGPEPPEQGCFAVDVIAAAGCVFSLCSKQAPWPERGLGPGDELGSVPGQHSLPSKAGWGRRESSSLISHLSSCPQQICLSAGIAQGVRQQKPTRSLVTSGVSSGGLGLGDADAAHSYQCSEFISSLHAFSPKPGCCALAPDRRPARARVPPHRPGRNTRRPGFGASLPSPASLRCVGTGARQTLLGSHQAACRVPASPTVLAAPLPEALAACRHPRRDVCTPRAIQARGWILRGTEHLSAPLRIRPKPANTSP